MIGHFGFWEIVIVVVLALVLLGPANTRKGMKKLGEIFRSGKKIMQQTYATFEQEDDSKKR